MHRNNKRSTRKNYITKRTTLKQYELPCMIGLQSWLSDEIYRTETEYSEQVSAELSSANYTTSTNSSNKNSVVSNLDLISNINITGSYYVEKWLHNQHDPSLTEESSQPKSSTPHKNSLRDVTGAIQKQRKLFATNAADVNSCIKLPPTSERPPCIGAENPDQPNPETEAPHKNNITTEFFNTNVSIQSDDTLFMENPLCILPVTFTRKRHPLLKKLQRIRNTVYRSTYNFAVV